MSFVYDFILPNDAVQFAYCVPYSYSKLLKLIPTLAYAKIMPSLKSLSGLSIPVLEITDQEFDEYNKKVILVTGRIHPGESNSSYVAQGILQLICGNQSLAKQLRKSYIFYVIPMLNPDGVIAGNYRTSFFGKDLNRTFDQSRKYAFPQTYHFLDLVKQLKKKHKKRFCIYLDLHGHSVKKNVFMYGPDFNIQHTNYELSRQLPRLLGNITSYFRFYSCIFRISGQKTATARAILNRTVDVPFTYTMESSNGFYYDSVIHNEMPFTAKKWKEMGTILCKGLGLLRLDQKIRRQIYQRASICSPIETMEQRNSDDQISQGKSDSEPQDEDLSQKELKEIQSKIQRKQCSLSPQKHDSPPRDLQKKNSKQLPKNQDKKQRPTICLPPINAMNRALIFSNRHKKKDSIKQQKLRNIESRFQELTVEKQTKPRLMLSQLVIDTKIKQTLKSSSFNLKMEGQNEPLPKFRTSK